MMPHHRLEMNHLELVEPGQRESQNYAQLAMVVVVVDLYHHLPLVGYFVGHFGVVGEVGRYYVGVGHSYWYWTDQWHYCLHVVDGDVAVVVGVVGGVGVQYQDH